MVLNRLINLIKAKLNKEMSELETPEVLAEQAQQQLEGNIKKVKDAVVAAVTNEKSLEKQIKQNTDDLAKWEQRAAVAVQQNNDEIARQCLQKKQETAQLLATLNAQLETQKKSTIDLKAQYSAVEEQLRDFNQKKSTIVARGKAGDAISKANELIGSGPTAGAGKWEQKILEKEARAQAMNEMGSQPIEDKFAQLDSASGIEDELSALKGKIAPKLIVDTNLPAVDQPLVDDNLPMVVDEKKDDKGKKP